MPRGWGPGWQADEAVVVPFLHMEMVSLQRPLSKSWLGWLKRGLDSVE